MAARVQRPVRDRSGPPIRPAGEPQYQANGYKAGRGPAQEKSRPWASPFGGGRHDGAVIRGSAIRVVKSRLAKPPDGPLRSVGAGEANAENLLNSAGKILTPEPAVPV